MCVASVDRLVDVLGGLQAVESALSSDVLPAWPHHQALRSRPPEGIVHGHNHGKETRVRQLAPDSDGAYREGAALSSGRTTLAVQTQRCRRQRE